jgi:hypothetical protein
LSQALAERRQHHGEHGGAGGEHRDR